MKFLFEKAGSNDSIVGDNYSTNLNKVSEYNQHFFELKQCQKIAGQINYMKQPLAFKL